MANNFFKVRNGISLGNLSSAPSNPITGDFYYDTTLNSFQGYQNGTWVALGTQVNSATGKNYLTPLLTSLGGGVGNPGNGNFETGTTAGWVIVNVTSAVPINGELPPGQAFLPGLYVFATSPASATAGATYTNNGQTFTVIDTVSSSSPLVCTGTRAPTSSGTLTLASGSGDSTITFGSFRNTTADSHLSFSVANSGQIAGAFSGNLVSSSSATIHTALMSNPFFIDLEDQGHRLELSFSYKVLSGTFDFSGTTSASFAIYVYDVDNASWIQPDGYIGLTSGSGVGQHTVSFASSSNGTKYQIALININAITGGYSLYVDDFVVKPAPTAPALPAQLVTEALIGSSTGGHATTSSVLLDFGFQTATAPTILVSNPNFTVSTAAVQTPKIVLTNAPAGYYVVSMLADLSTSASARMGIAIGDGVTNGSISTFFPPSNALEMTVEARATFKYTVSETRTFSLLGQSINGTTTVTVNTAGTNGRQLLVTITYFPLVV